MPQFNIAIAKQAFEAVTKFVESGKVKPWQAGRREPALHSAERADMRSGPTQPYSPSALQAQHDILTMLLDQITGDMPAIAVRQKIQFIQQQIMMTKHGRYKERSTTGAYLG